MPEPHVFPDFAGSGAGLANRELMKALQAGCRDLRFGPASPRHLLREVILKSGTRTPWEDLLVEGMLQTRLGRDYWPGDAAPSANWPGFAPRNDRRAECFVASLTTPSEPGRTRAPDEQTQSQLDLRIRRCAGIGFLAGRHRLLWSGRTGTRMAG